MALDRPTHKMVNGVLVALSQDEAAAIEDEWHRNDLRQVEQLEAVKARIAERILVREGENKPLSGNAVRG